MSPFADYSPMQTAVHATPAHAPLAVTTRGSAIESVHYGSVAVVDRNGCVLFAAGDPEALTFARSALKPLQALPFVAGGGPERFGFSAAQIALLCASHSGEPRHIESVADMLAKSGSTPADLQCGTHAPGYYEAAGRVPPPPPYSPLAHNCSGKHAGMLAYCVLCGHSKADYLDYEHPLQQAIRPAVAALAGMPEAALVPGVDGCSAPNYALPLSRLALAFARLTAAEPHAVYGRAPQILASAMTENPDMVSGAHRSDLALMEAGRGDWVTKIGAEGVQAIGIRSQGLGIAIKIADGQKRGLYPTIVAVLEQLGLLDTSAREQLRPWGEPSLKNYRGTQTGKVCSIVVLDKR